MPNLSDHIHEKLVDRITQIIDEHCAESVDDGTDAACRCGAQGLSDHSRHVAEQIIDQLGLMPQNIDEAKKRLRYVSASLDWELTKLEGAQC
jgi:heterodisulfide reductase subunit B